MKKLIFTLVGLFTALALFAGAPEVTGVTASQQEGLVLIDYYLAHPDEMTCMVSVEISNDGGITYGIIPSPASLSGAVGLVQATAQGAAYQIVWDYSQDGIPSGTNYRAKVIADDNVVIPSPLTHVLTAVDLPFFANLDEMSMVLLNTAPVAYYTPGNILVMAPCAQIPSGLMRKVVNFSPAGNLICMETVTATLEEAFDQVRIDFSGDLKASDIVSFHPLVDGVTYVPGGKDLSHTFNMNFEMTTDEGVKLAVSGEVTISLGHDLTITVSGPFWNKKLSYLQAGGHGDVDATIDLEIGGELSVDKKIELFEVVFATIYFQAGPVPVWMTPSVALVLELEAGVGASVTTSVRDSVYVAAGIEYDKGEWSSYGTYDNHFSYEPPSLSTDLHASVAAGPQLELNLYSIAGPFLFTPLYLELKADILDSPWWVLMGGFKADAGVEVEVLGVGMEWGTTIFDVSDTLAHAETEQVATPAFDPFDPDGYDSEGYLEVIIDCSDDEDSIHYTTDGSNPTTASTLYSGGVNINCDTTLKARAFKSPWKPSEVASADYTISIPAVATPEISPAAGNYLTSVEVSISCTSTNVDIHYTTDGSTPTTTSLLYSVPFTLSESATVKARAFDTDTTHDPLYNPSLTASAAYVVLSEEEFPASMDASIHITLPNSNDGTGERLTVRNASGNPLYPPPAGAWQIDTLIWFSLASIPGGSTIDSATLKLYYYDFKDNDPAGRTLSLFRATQVWNEANVTWNNQPLWAGAASSTAQVPSSTYNWMEWDVTADIQACVSGTAINYGWKITDLVPWNQYNIPTTYFRSREYVNSTQRPYLEVQLDGKAETLIIQ